MHALDSRADVGRIESLVCGANAGLLTRFLIAPLDFLKIRLQLHHGSSLLSTAGGVLRQEGIRAFWKGNSPAEVLYVTYSATQFATLQAINHLWCQIDPSSAVASEQVRQLIAGGIAGSVATLVSYPSDFLRTRLAANQQRNSTAALRREISMIWQKEGLRGFYHGALATVVSVFPYMGLFFASYSYLRDDSARYRMPAWMPQLVTAASIAAVFSKSAVFPLDTIRKRVQVHGDRTIVNTHTVGHGQRYSHNFVVCGSQIVAREGIRGLYRGLGIALTKAWPGSVLSLYFYEVSLRGLRAAETLCQSIPLQ